MLFRLAKRMVTETDWRILGKFAWNLGGKGLLSMHRFKTRLKRGRNFPPVLFVSVTTQCNLRCQGCWVSVDGPGHSMPADDLDRIITEGKRNGVCLFGILGGEPLLYPGLWDVLARHGESYFQVFTNGTLLTEADAQQMRRLGNITPLISIEGLAETSDVRRGGSDVYDGALDAVEHCRRNRLPIGVATSVCQSNIDELVTERFLADLIERGVHYVWYYIYRPAGPRPCPELALTDEQILRLRRFIVEMRPRWPILIVDAYWDDRGRAMCPAATGISYHVSPFGDVELCPPIQFAAANACNGQSLYETIDTAPLLRDFRRTAAEATRGCLLMERPELLAELVATHGAKDSSGRGTAMAELQATCPCPSHHSPGQEIPETHWMYRFAKKNWFMGFGAYG